MSLILKPLVATVLNEEFFQIPREDRVVSVGRSERNDLQIDHISVSGMHARLECSGHNGVEVVDCDSSNGTFVNGLKISRQHIRNGDMLRFATAEFRVLESDDAAPEVEQPEESTAEAESGEEPSFEDLAERLKAFESEKEFLNLKLEKATQRNNDLDERLREREQDLSSARSDLEERESKIGALESEKASLDSELKEAVQENEQLKERLGDKDRELASVGEDLSEKENQVKLLIDDKSNLEEERRRFLRDAESAAEREVRLNQEISRNRSEVMDRDGTIAGLQYEISRRDGWIGQKDEIVSDLQTRLDAHTSEIESLTSSLRDSEQSLLERSHAAETAEKKISGALVRLRRFTDGVLSDWKWWLDSVDVTPLQPSGDEGDFDSMFDMLDNVRERIQQHLDRLEPVWKKFGAGAQRELETLCESLRREQSELSDSVISRQKELAELNQELDDLRQEMDREVRRAQGLSRRGMEIEIPERFESMVIARDSEEEIFRMLIQRIEFFDRLLDGYRRSKKLKEALYELEEFRLRLLAILEANGVRPFEVAVGTDLTLKHRKQVKILGRKGWGTREFAEIPFKPGKVETVVRPGYQIGSGETASILRKVEVLIRETVE